MQNIEAARLWRSRFGYVGRGGVVVLFDDDAQGWVDELRNPEHWRPGCVAVDENGCSWTAVGGNDEDGASQWAANATPP